MRQAAPEKMELLGGLMEQVRLACMVWFRRNAACLSVVVVTYKERGFRMLQEFGAQELDRQAADGATGYP